MKKITRRKVREEAKYFCDKHPSRECFSKLETCSWYGSGYDMLSMEIHLCDECLEKMLKYLERKFKVKLKEMDMM